MNKQLLTEYIPFNLSPQILKESLENNGGRLIVKGIIQRADVKNGNGRIYPKAILEREIEKYKNTFIKERRGLGELDHNCFIEGYKILTKERGWVLFEDLKGDENVATLNMINEELEYQPILHVTNSSYSGDIINIESKTFQANVTPNHKFVVTNQYDIKKGKGLKFIQADKISKSSFIPKMSKCKIDSPYGFNEGIVKKDRKNSKYYHMSNCNKTITHYDGRIHCVTVENGTILVMSPKGSTFWSGNSDSVIHLKNVSHNILDIWWEGNDVMAKIEILPTPAGNILRALIESKITVGISSRAMGSVKPLGEAVEVQDDLDLICWDFVSTPSTQGAFMEVVQESLIKSPKSIKNISKINELVSEIICNNTGFCECEFKK